MRKRKVKAMKYLGQRYPSDDYRIRLTRDNGTYRYRRFPTELAAKAFMGREIITWERMA